MRAKFKTERYTTEQELLFIEKLERTHDSFGLSDRTLSVMLDTNPRTLRKFKEMYNNMKYSNITPQGKIVCLNGLYKLVRHNSKYANRIVNKAKFDMLCGIIDYRNTLKTVGLSTEGQLQMDELFRMSEQDLIELAKSYEVELKEVE